MCPALVRSHEDYSSLRTTFPAWFARHKGYGRVPKWSVSQITVGFHCCHHRKSRETHRCFAPSNPTHNYEMEH